MANEVSAKRVKMECYHGPGAVPDFRTCVVVLLECLSGGDPHHEEAVSPRATSAVPNELTNQLVSSRSN
jgi:hypothetical protein